MEICDLNSVFKEICIYATKQIIFQSFIGIQRLKLKKWSPNAYGHHFRPDNHWTIIYWEREIFTNISTSFTNLDSNMS